MQWWKHGAEDGHFQLYFYVTAPCIAQLYAETLPNEQFLDSISFSQTFTTLPDFSIFLPTMNRFVN